MTDWFNILDYLLAGGLLVMMAIGIVFSASMPALDRWNKRYFITLFSLLFLCTVSCFFAVLFWQDPTKAAQAKIVYLFEGLFLSTPIFMPTLFLLHSCGEKLKSCLLFKTVTTLQGIYIVFLVAAQFTDAVYRVTPDNQFIRGPLWALWLVSLALIMLLNIVGVIRRRKKLSKKYYIALLEYLLPMTVAIILHMFISVELYIIFGIAFFAMIMFGLILSDNMEQYAGQQQEIIRQRTNALMLQIRPHFVYNTLTSIYCMIEDDPAKAKEVTNDFTNYLRNNFTAIAQDKPIPFTKELEHTKAYLAVEQARFEGLIFFEFDTPVVNFRIPALTLQPIVENAVKHGVDPELDPLYISVLTKETENGVEISVIDTGPGFDEIDNDEPHIALSNIRERLEMMCKGTLTITPRDVGGMAVTVFVPIAHR
ncbi:MAG: histidine kinase [Ruminococcus sp.]|nr:histidine kinase [Ruminococcus sp.]